MRALILAGGFGTRLRSVLSDRPKPLAPVAGRPFVTYLIQQLARHDVKRMVLATGYMADKVEEALGDGAAWGVELRYSREMEPLGTGGAIRQAEPLLGGEPFFVLNGDSFLDADLSALASSHRGRGALVTVALARVGDTSRYGRVESDEIGRITGFVEKGETSGEGWINGGIYVMSPEIFDLFPRERNFSLERDLFPSIIGDRFYAFPVEGFFRDIGVPEDYRKMCENPRPLLRAVGLGD